MKDHRFPSWSAPLIGMIAGSLCGLRGGLNAQDPLYIYTVAGLIIGGLAGSLIFFLDPRRPTPDAIPGMSTHLYAGHSDNPSGVVGRFLAVAGCLLCWTPFLGFILNALGLAVNWKSSDWARIVSIFGLLVGTLVAMVIGLGLAFGIID